MTKRSHPDPHAAPRVAILGVPWDERSSFLRGAALAPPVVRAALRSPSSNLSTESGLDLDAEPRLLDPGDLEVPPGDAALAAIEQGVARVLAGGARVLALGGDHAISYPVVRAQARTHGPLAILHLDAHPELYDEFEGDRFSLACPFARIMDEGLAGRLVQVGIRTANAHQRAQAARFGVETIAMAAWRPDLALELDGPLLLTEGPRNAPAHSRHRHGRAPEPDLAGGGRGGRRALRMPLA